MGAPPAGGQARRERLGRVRRVHLLQEEPGQNPVHRDGQVRPEGVNTCRPFSLPSIGLSLLFNVFRR